MFAAGLLQIFQLCRRRYECFVSLCRFLPSGKLFVFFTGHDNKFIAFGNRPWNSNSCHIFNNTRIMRECQRDCNQWRPAPGGMLAGYYRITKQCRQRHRNARLSRACRRRRGSRACGCSQKNRGLACTLSRPGREQSPVPCETTAAARAHP